MIAAEVAAELQTLGVGTVDTDIFYHDWPDDDAGAYDTAILVRQYGGSPTEHTFDGPTTESPGIQVMARSRVPSTAATKIQAAFDALDGFAEATLTSTHVNLMRANQSPAFLYVDDAGRHVWVVNFSTVIPR